MTPPIKPSPQGQASRSSTSSAVASVLLIDNFDSFTYNLVHLLQQVGAQVRVVRNQHASPHTLVEDYRPSHLLISPGPGRPEDGGISMAMIELAARRSIPLLGVCLGHQCLARCFGGTVVQVAPVHGHTSSLTHDQQGLYHGLPQGFAVARYHSLAVAQVPSDLEVSAWLSNLDGPPLVLGLRHRRLPLFGMQYHPESFMSEFGASLMRAFLATSAARSEVEGSE